MKLPKVVRSLSKTSLSLGYGVDTVFAALTRPPSSTHLVERDDFILASSRVKPNLSSLSDIGIFLTAPSDRISRPRGERFAGSFTYPGINVSLAYCESLYSLTLRIRSPSNSRRK